MPTSKPSEDSLLARRPALMPREVLKEAEKLEQFSIVLWKV